MDPWSIMAGQGVDMRHRSTGKEGATLVRVVVMIANSIMGTVCAMRGGVAYTFP